MKCKDTFKPKTEISFEKTVQSATAERLPFNGVKMKLLKFRVIAKKTMK